MKVLVYEMDGEAISDFGVEDTLSYIKTYETRLFSYSIENIFNRVRLGIASGELNVDEWGFVFNGKKLPLNNYGAIPDWPDGFCDYNMSVCEQILRKALEKKRAERKKISVDDQMSIH